MKYCLLQELECQACRGEGFNKIGYFDPVGEDNYYEEIDCEDCKGKGVIYRPREVIIEEGLIKEIK